MDISHYFVKSCPICNEPVEYSDEFYCCSSGTPSTSHFYIDLKGPINHVSPVEIFYIHLVFPKFFVEVDFNNSFTVFYQERNTDNYKKVNKLLTYDEILRYHDLWIMS